MILLGGHSVPAHRFGEVFENTLTIGVHGPEVELRIGVILLGGHSVPAHRFGEVFENTLAFVIHAPEVELCDGKPLPGGHSVPAYRFGIVLRDAFAIGVHESQVILCVGVSLVSSLTDRVEIVLCREHHDGEATHHDHGSSYADQPWYFIYRLQM